MIANSTPSDTIDTSLNIYPLTFQCDGTETNLTNCTTASLMTHIHEFDVFITCSNGMLNFNCILISLSKKQ